jgi:TetR/AcrR family transcriptional regulator, regulator of cefoperazone and chloramphenicol sensitivity
LYGQIASTDQSFRKLDMRSVREDLTTRAVIRDEALRLFAESGPEAVSLRRVAAAAGVSPGLVAHHFGSKAGLREAVDAHVERVFDALFAAMDDTDWTGEPSAGSLAEAFVAALPPDSPIPAYLRRLLLSGDPAGQRLFGRWYEASRVAMDRLAVAGAVRPAADPAVRTAFLMVNDLAVLLLREQLCAVLGVDPLSRDGMSRWAGEVLAVYQDGLFVRGEGETQR